MVLFSSNKLVIAPEKHQIHNYLAQYVPIFKAWVIMNAGKAVSDKAVLRRTEIREFATEGNSR